MTRILLFRAPQPSDTEPGDKHLWFRDGLVADLDADVRCGTCRHWRQAPMLARAGECMAAASLDGTARHKGAPAVAMDHGQYQAVLSTDADFGCAKWEPKPRDVEAEARELHDEYEAAFQGRAWDAVEGFNEQLESDPELHAAFRSVTQTLKTTEQTGDTGGRDDAEAD